MEDAPKAKKTRTWSAKTIAKREAARAQKARDREIIKQENADPANKEWMKKVRKEMRGSKPSKPRKRRKSVAKKERGTPGWVKREVKRLEGLAKARKEGVKLKKRINYKKYAVGALSADFKRVPKEGKTRS